MSSDYHSQPRDWKSAGRIALDTFCVLGSVPLLVDMLANGNVSPARVTQVAFGFFCSGLYLGVQIMRRINGER